MGRNDQVLNAVSWKQSLHLGPIIWGNTICHGGCGLKRLQLSRLLWQRPLRKSKVHTITAFLKEVTYLFLLFFQGSVICGVLESPSTWHLFVSWLPAHGSVPVESRCRCQLQGMEPWNKGTAHMTEDEMQEC